MIWSFKSKKINRLLLSASESRRVPLRKWRRAFPIFIPVDMGITQQIFTRMIFYTKRSTIPQVRDLVVLRLIWAGLC